MSKPARKPEPAGPQPAAATGDGEPYSFEPLNKAIAEMSKNPRSGVEMCHEQGKTAVYLSEDGKWIVSEPPPGRGPITRKPFDPDAQP